MFLLSTGPKLHGLNPALKSFHKPRQIVQYNIFKLQIRYYVIEVCCYRLQRLLNACQKACSAFPWNTDTCGISVFLSGSMAGDARIASEFYLSREDS